MQGKVSMVVPCYNKEEYIEDMLHSVCRQIWDNMEVILVNDGSTDTTRDVIALWEPRLRERGYEVIIVDQENQGCCAAVYNGMLRMTGDYFCLVDCDDEIMPEYVSRMAGWLDDNPEYEAASCNFVMYRGTREYQTNPSLPKMEYTPDAPNLLENYLLVTTSKAVWHYMSRRSLADQIISRFYTKRVKTYEPCILLPIAFANVKIKFFNEALYKFNLYANGFVGFKNYEQVEDYYKDFAFLHAWVINSYDISENKKKRLIALGELGCLRRKSMFAVRLGITPEQLKALTYEFSEYAKKYFKLYPLLQVPEEDMTAKDIGSFCGALKDNILGFREIDTANRRVIAWGALGKRAKKWLPLLKNTALEPTELWDVSGDGVNVIKPDVSGLSSSDIVIVFPLDDIAAEISSNLKGVGCSIMLNKDIIKHVNIFSLYRFYNGSLCFNP